MFASQHFNTLNLDFFNSLTGVFKYWFIICTNLFSINRKEIEPLWNALHLPFAFALPSMDIIMLLLVSQQSKVSRAWHLKPKLQIWSFHLCIHPTGTELLLMTRSSQVALGKEPTCQSRRYETQFQFLSKEDPTVQTAKRTTVIDMTSFLFLWRLHVHTQALNKYTNERVGISAMKKWKQE